VAQLVRQRGENCIDIGYRVGNHVDECLRMERCQRRGQATLVSAIEEERHGARRHKMVAAVGDADLMPRGEQLLRDPGADKTGTA
jgi:hypothetical protein